MPFFSPWSSAGSSGALLRASRAADGTGGEHRGRPDGSRTREGTAMRGSCGRPSPAGRNPRRACCVLALVQPAREVADDEPRRAPPSALEELAHAHRLAARALVRARPPGTGAGRCTASASAPGPPGACASARTSASTSPSRSVTPGKSSRLSATYAPRSPGERDRRLHVLPAVLHRLVVGLVEVLHRRVERHAARRPAPRRSSASSPCGQAAVGVDVDGALVRAARA